MRFFDLHCDTAYKCFKEGISFNNESLAVTPKKAEFLKEWHQCFAIFIKDDAKNPFALYKSIFENFKKELKNKPDCLTPCFTLEGGSLIDSTEKVSVLKNDGIKSVTLTWNGENGIAGGVDSNKGLTAFGKEVVLALNQNNIFTDLSHLNEKSFFDVISLAKYPIASHSNAKAVCYHKRNLTDRQISLIAERGGLIGLCFYPEFLKGDVFEAVYRNIYHLLSMGLEDNISIGSDFDGADMLKSLDGIDKIPALLNFLEQKRIEKYLLDKIFYKNALKYFTKQTF